MVVSCLTQVLVEEQKLLHKGWIMNDFESQKMFILGAEGKARQRQTIAESRCYLPA
jgi:hypothetical protein